MMYRCLQRRSPVEGHLVVVPMLILKKQHILDNFSTLPKVDDLCNRHILYLYITSGECSRAKTERQLRAHFPSIYAEQGSNTLNNAIKRTVSQTIDNKLKKLSDSNEFITFSSICSQKFYLHIDISQEIQPSTSHTSTEQPTAHCCHQILCSFKTTNQEQLFGFER